MAESSTPEDRELLRAIAALAADEPDAFTGSLIGVIAARMPAMLVLLDPAARILWLNRANTGTLADYLGRSVLEFSTPGDREEIRAAFDRVLETGQLDRFVGHGPGKRGPRSRYESWVAPISRDGKVIALALLTRDVSEEWELYQQLRDREQRLSLVLDAAGMGTWRFDRQTLTVDLDERARAIYGLAESRIAARTFTSTRIHPEDRETVDRAAFASVATRQPYASENRILHPDGRIHWVAITGSPVVDERGEIVALMGTVMDITARREHAAHALQAQRLEAVGQLTAGIAHNFNNVLAAIMPTLAIAEQEVRPATVAIVRGAAQAAGRAAELVQQLMTFAGRNRPHVRTPEPPGLLVERTIALCRSTFGREITLAVEIAEDLPEVHVDAGQIEQSLLNLLLNARDAVEHFARHPTVIVRASLVTTPVRSIAIAIEDNGPGVPDELRARVFDPFFTTKEVGRGTGLGLSTAYAIVREHGGSLAYEPAPAGGARFSLLIPVIGGDPAPRTPRTVLVVDDDALVRGAVEAVLAAAGYAVRTVSDGERAIAALAPPGRIDVMLLDITTTGPSWEVVVDATRRTSPTTRIVAYTGGVTPPDVPVDGWLAKPAVPAAILGAIAAAIEN